MIDPKLFMKLECLKIAAKEQLEMNSILDEINVDDVVSRGKEYYLALIKSNIQKWGSEFTIEDFPGYLKEELSNSKQVKSELVEEVIKESKICPKCGEEVPSGFAEHLYKSDGQPCGYKFGDE